MTDADDIWTRCRQLLPALGETHVFSHRTAARLWGIPLEPRYTAGEALHVLTVGGRAPLRHHGTVGWVTGRTDVGRRVLHGLPLADPAEVWCQLALRGAVRAGETLAEAWLVAAGDHLISGQRVTGGRTPPLATPVDLREVVDRLRGGRGAAMLSTALERLRGPVDSPRESLLRVGLVDAGLPEPRVQVPVRTSVGWRHADLGYPEHRLLIEYQGDEHRTSRARWLTDLTRVQLFQDAGYVVLLVGAADMDPDCTALAARIRRALLRTDRETTR